MAEPVRLDHFRERVEVPTNARPLRRERPPLYVVSQDRPRALDWAWRNRPGHDVKHCPPDSLVAPRGLKLKDETVFVLDAPTRAVRDAWIRTGAHLVYL